MKKPLVSLLIPAYKPVFFEAALKSALEQDYPNLEVVIGDDSPDDEIQLIVDKFKDSRITYIKNSPAKGPMYNYVFLCEQSSGEYIKFLNDDDELHPECVSRMVSWLREPRVTLVTCRREEVDAEGRSLPTRLDTLPLVGRDVVLNGRDLAAAMLFYRLNYVGEPSCMMFRKSEVMDVRPHPLSYHGLGRERSGLGDVALALNLLEKGDCAYLGSDVLVRIRKFEGQWQEVSAARNWSLRSWSSFREEAMKSAFIRPWHGFRIQCESEAGEGFIPLYGWRQLIRRWRVSRGEENV